MELRHLRYFVAVATDENVTRAAAKLHVSQPAVSRQIHDLEDELGVILLERTAKTVRLTEPGRLFLVEAQAALARVDEAVKNVRAAAGGLQGEIRVGYAPTLAVEILPSTLRKFQSEFPGVRVSLHDLSSDEMRAGLENGSLDVAFTANPDAPETCEFVELARYSVVVAVAPGHRLAGNRSITLAELASEELEGYERAAYPEYYRSIETLYAGASVRPRFNGEHDGAMSLITALESSSNVALVSSGLACIVGPRLKLIPLDPPGPQIVVGIARRTGVPSQIVRNFIAAAKIPVKT